MTEIRDTDAVQRGHSIQIAPFAEIIGVVVAQANCVYAALQQHILIRVRRGEVKRLFHFYRVRSKCCFQVGNGKIVFPEHFPDLCQVIAVIPVVAFQIRIETVAPVETVIPSDSAVAYGGDLDGFAHNGRNRRFCRQYGRIIANSFGIRYAKDARGVWLAVILSSLVFGTAHLLNTSVGVSLHSVLAQSVTAFVFGLYFAAIYFRGGNIWVMMLIHALTDAPGLFHTLFTVTDVTQIDALNESSFEEWYLYPVFLLLTVFLLRKKKMAEITANLCSCSKEDESSKSYIDKVHIS